MLSTPCTLLTPVSPFPLRSLIPRRSLRSCRLWWSMCPVRALLSPMSHTLFTLRPIKYSLVPGPVLVILPRTLALMLLSLLLPSQLFITVDAAFPPIFLTSLLLFLYLFYLHSFFAISFLFIHTQFLPLSPLFIHNFNTHPSQCLSLYDWRSAIKKNNGHTKMDWFKDSKNWPS